MTEQEFYTTSEVSRITGIKSSTLNAWRWKNKGPKFVKFDKLVRYPIKSFREWVNGEDKKAH